MKNRLKMAIPTGSLQKDVLDLLRAAGYEMELQERSYRPDTNDDELWVKMLRPQEIPSLIDRGVYDLGISGMDWIMETGSDVERIIDLGIGGFTIVLAVSEESDMFKVEDLKNLDPARVSTEYVSLAKSYLDEQDITRASIHFSWGATEAKPPEDADAIIDGFQTGTTLEQNRLRILDDVLDSSAWLFANKEALKDDWKKQKIEGVRIMIAGAILAKGKVLIKLNVPAHKLKEIADLVPAMEQPTISELYGEEWYALETVVDEKDLVQLIPRMKMAGAKDIIEYDLKKVIP